MGQRDSVVPTTASIVIHAGILVIAGWWISSPAAHVPPEPPREVDIELAPPPPPPPILPPGTAAGATHDPDRKPAPSGRRGHQRQSAVLPSHAVNPYGELTISVDQLGPDSANGLGETGLGDGLDGDGLGGNGAGNGRRPTRPAPLPDTPPPPPPPPPVLARPPRAKYDYSEAVIHGSRAYAGKKIRLVLAIDDHGVVRSTHLVESVELHFDLHAINKAMKFEFEPALDTSGAPVASTFPWTFVVMQ